MEVSATIVPSALHGLPVTADQDKYLALQEIVRAQQHGGAPVSNPVTFSSAALLRSLGLCDSGRNHLDVSEWLDLMASTTIISEGAVYLAGSRRWARDRFRVFDRAVSRGGQLDDGAIAERNHVWFSDWQLQNINGRYLLPIDFEVYRQLRTHIARALVLHLQIWLYASQRAQVFEKRYADVCQLLGLRAYEHHSKIVEKLGPALEELASHRYLSSWQIARTSDEQAFKLVLKHGPLFTGETASMAVPRRFQSQLRRDATTCTTRTEGTDRAGEAAPDVDEALEDELTRRGVTTRRARQLLAKVSPTQDVLRQLEWGDFVISRAAPGTFWNPAGFYVALLRDNVEPPATFPVLSPAGGAGRGAPDTRRGSGAQGASLRRLWPISRRTGVRPPGGDGRGDRERALDVKAQELRSRFPTFSWTAEHLRSVAETSLRSEVAAQLPLLDFHSFVDRMPANDEAPREMSEEGPCPAHAM